MTPHELAKSRVHVDVELGETISLRHGQIQRWYPRNHMDLGPVTVYIKKDGTAVIPADGPASLEEALRDLRPPLDQPDEFVDLFNALMWPGGEEVTGILRETGMQCRKKFPEPQYAADQLAFVVEAPVTDGFLRVVISGDYHVRFEELYVPEA